MQHQEATLAMPKTAAATVKKHAKDTYRRNLLPIKVGTRGRTTESRRLEAARTRTGRARPNKNELLTRGRTRELRLQETERNKQGRALLHVVEYCNHKVSCAEQEARECHQEAQSFRRMVMALLKRAGKRAHENADIVEFEQILLDLGCELRAM